MKEELGFRTLTLSDEIWIQDTFPGYAESMTTDSIDKNILTAILFRTMTTKELFKKIQIEDIDEDGNEDHKTIGGLELFRSKVVTDDDLAAMLMAFIEVCNKSRPQNEELVKKKIWLKRSILWPSLTVFVLGIIGAITMLWRLP